MYNFTVHNLTVFTVNDSFLTVLEANVRSSVPASESNMTSRHCTCEPINLCKTFTEGKNKLLNPCSPLLRMCELAR